MICFIRHLRDITLLLANGFPFHVIGDLATGIPSDYRVARRSLIRKPKFDRSRDTSSGLIRKGKRLASLVPTPG